MRRPIISIVALLWMVPLATHAIPIQTTVGQLDVTTVQGTFADLSATLMDQLWWGDAALADEIAGLVGDALGIPEAALGIGPFFAYALEFNEPPQQDRAINRAWCGPGNPFECEGVSTFLIPVSRESTFAIAEFVAVPEPRTLALLGAALLALAATRRRRKP